MSSISSKVVKLNLSSRVLDFQTIKQINMIIVKEVKLVSNDQRKNVVVQYLESIPTTENPNVLRAQRESELSFEEALKEIGTELEGVIIKAPCMDRQHKVEKQNNLHDWICFATRFVYVENGDSVLDLLSPITTQEEIDAQAHDFQAWKQFNLNSNEDEE